MAHRDTHTTRSQTGGVTAGVPSGAACPGLWPPAGGPAYLEGERSPPPGLQPACRRVRRAAVAKSSPRSLCIRRAPRAVAKVCPLRGPSLGFRIYRAAAVVSGRGTALGSWHGVCFCLHVGSGFLGIGPTVEPGNRLCSCDARSISPDPDASRNHTASPHARVTVERSPGPSLAQPAAWHRRSKSVKLVTSSSSVAKMLPL